METTITMTAKEQHRAWILTRVLGGELTMAEAAATLGLSERQLWRFRVAFRALGPRRLRCPRRRRPTTPGDPSGGARSSGSRFASELTAAMNRKP
jgi:hypothetical protein